MKNKIVKISFFTNFLLLLIIVSINFINTLFANINIFQRWYNQSNSGISNVLKIPNEIISSSYLISSKAETKWMIKSYLANHNYSTNNFEDNIEKAKYLIIFDKFEDIGTIKGDEIQSWDKFHLYPTDNFLVPIGDYHQSEKEMNDYHMRSVRWIYDQHNNQGSIEYKINFYGKFKNDQCILIGISPGPALVDSHLLLQYTLNSLKKTIEISGTDIHCLPLNQLKSNFSLLFNGNAINELFPLEQRRLVAKIFSLNLIQNTEFDKYRWQLLNPNNTVSKNISVFGNGWHDIESHDFRWSAGESEILVLNPTNENSQLQIEIEPGPSVQSLPMEILLVDANQNEIGKVQLKDKQLIKFNIDTSQKTVNKFFIKTTAQLHSINTDKRLLAFRVFRFITSSQLKD